jgi:formylmethanofuran dehydrogenase subunit E
MFRSHRIHEEQIKKSAQNLKALYQIRNTGSATTESSGLAVQQAIRPEKSHGKDRGATGNLSMDNRHIQSPEAFTPPSIPARRCKKCNARIPAIDFLYTKKTGLCIPCWEEQVVRDGNEKEKSGTDEKPDTSEIPDR